MADAMLATPCEHIVPVELFIFPESPLDEEFYFSLLRGPYPGKGLEVPPSFGFTFSTISTQAIHLDLRMLDLGGATLVWAYVFHNFSAGRPEMIHFCNGF